MKSRYNRFHTPLLKSVLATVIVAVAPMANAATFTWDSDGLFPLNDGSGTWASTGGTNWYNNTSSVFGVWDNTTADEAIFGAGSGAAGTVTVSGTVNANKLTFNSPGSGNYIITGGTGITLGGGTPTITANTDATIDAVLAGTAGFTKAGAGILSMGGNNSLTGEIKLTAGTLRLTGSGGNQIADTSLMNVGGGTLDLNGRSETIRQLSNSGGTVVNNAVTQSLLTLNIAGNGEQNFAGSVNGNIRVAVTNSPTKNTNLQMFTGTNGYTGGTLIDNGHLRVTTDAGLGAVPASFDAANVTLQNGGVLQNRDSDPVLHANRGITLGTGGGVIYVGWSKSMTVNGGISGANNLTKTDSGTLFLNGANTYTGTTTITQGPLQLGNGGTTGSLSPSSAITNNGTLAFNRSDDISQGVHFSSAPITGTGTLSKLGTGKLTLNAANTFTGSTTITSGSLRLDYTNQDNSKLSNTSFLVFGSNPVTLELTGGSHTEVVQSTTLNNNSTATITRQPGSTAVIQLGSINRSPGATLTLGEPGIATTSTLNNAGGILGTWAMIGNDWAVNSTNAANGPITAFTAYTDHTRLSSGAKVIADGATTNIRIVEGTGVAGALSLGAATTYVNSLKHTASGGGTLIDTGTNTLRLGVSGGILTDAGGAALTIGATPGQGILSAGGNVTNIPGEIFLNQAGGSPVTINASITNNGTGAVSLSKLGSGDLTLAGANTYTGATMILGGVVTHSPGSSLDRTSTGDLKLGGAVGKGVLNLNTTGSVRFSTIRVGGENGSFDTGKGAINQTIGTVFGGGNLELGMGVGPGGALTDTYGSYVLSGGSLSSGRARIGNGGLGVFTQSNGACTFRDYLVIGASDSADSYGTGVATFTGGSAAVTGNRILICDRNFSTGTLNIGTLAGGNATLENNGTQELTMLGNSNARSATVNLNGGTLTVGGPFKRNTGNNNAANTSAVNLNGGTLKVKGGTSLIDAHPLMMVNLFNGGLKVDTQANTTTIGANLLATTGNGIYPAGGTFNLPAPGGAGYIGAPIVTVTSSGAGTGATAIANVANGQVTGVTLTCPGQGYLAGDTVSFAFAGGGFGTAAGTFAYNLQPADLAANGSGGLTKLGSGKLTVNGTEGIGGLLSVEGKLAAGNLSLGSGGLKIVNYNPATPGTPLEATTALTTSAATVPVEISGAFALGTWPLIYYPFGSSVGGNGAAALQLNTGALPRGVVASLVDNAGNSSVDLDVTGYNPLTWKGTTNGNWDINTTTNWTIGATPEKYLDNDIVLFDDSVGAGPTSVVLNTVVSPSNLAFDNDTKNYTLSGTGAITGGIGLTKTNNGTLLIRNANTYTGTTTVDGGVLQLGDGTSNGSVAGPLVNNASVVFNPAGTSAAFAGAMSGFGTFQKTGSGTQVFVGTTNTATGLFEINEGTYQIGNGVLNGVAGSSLYQIASGATMRLEQATAQAQNTANISGAGTLALNSAQPVNGSALWGGINFPAEFTGTLRIEKGRMEAQADGNAWLGGTSRIQILAGAQIAVGTSVEPYPVPIEIAGNGAGEGGQPGALRLVFDRTATWAGSVTLTADSGIRVQRNANLTITGSITGPHRCDIFLGDSGGAASTLNLAPVALVQNSYGSTRIDGQPTGSVVAGNERAFSSGPLEMANGTLKLNGYNFSFASLSGTGGQIGNFSPSSPSLLTVGNAADTSYAGIMMNGDAAPLSLAKTGAGKLTLSGFCLYSGDTTVNAGTLDLAETARLRFVLGAGSGVSNKLTGSGSASINGDFVIDTSAASALTAGTWVIENVASLTGAYGSTFQVLSPDGSPWTDAGANKWTRSEGTKSWSFDETTGTLTLGVSGYNSWADSWPGLTDKTPGGDPDRDGISNLMEYVIGGDPRVSSSEFLPKQTIVGPNLVISYKRRDESESDITLTGQWSTTLGAWTNVPAVLVSENGANPDDMTITIPLSNAVNGKLFGRIRATQP